MVDYNKEFRKTLKMWERVKDRFVSPAISVTNGNSHDHNGGDGAQINHTTLSNIGTNTHAQVDTAISASTSHIAASAPHSGHAIVGTQTDVTSSRALDTTYTNGSSTRSIMVMTTVRCAISLAAGNAYIQAKSDSSTPPTTIASGLVGIEAGLLNEDNTFQIVFVVAPSLKYRIDSSATNGTCVKGSWFEVTI